MAPELSVFPPRASEHAARVDSLTLFGVLATAFFSLVIASLIFYFGVKYRRRHPSQVGSIQGPAPASLELAWTILPLGTVLVLFYWGASVYLEVSRPPADAIQYFVIGRQWMWKFQHPDGQREINELHVPVGRAIKLTMTSEDVVHSFYVPAFRTKWDVVPGRYTTTWFKADVSGTYPLFCAEYCGTEHSKMIGRVIVMDPHQYEEWLSGSHQGRPAAASGQEIFAARGCPSCHRPDTAVRAPILVGLMGKRVELARGEVVTADESYVRESILEPAAKVVGGYQPVMPSYKGQLSEEEVIQLIAYIAAQKGAAGAPAGGDAGSPEGDAGGGAR